MQLKNLYAPLYGMILVMVTHESMWKSEDEKVCLFLRDVTDVNKLSLFNEGAVDKLMIDNMGYASNSLIRAFLKIKERKYGLEAEHEFITIAIKEFQELSKLLGLPFNKEEMLTGIPERYVTLRNLIK
ncbi:hypothetical protein JCM19047_2540 [Bacillus sp. JCM 19047]|nr:hypothetical protein JCM19047_2540 [Bacillus sp. JCM 19047]